MSVVSASHHIAAGVLFNDAATMWAASGVLGRVHLIQALLFLILTLATQPLILEAWHSSDGQVLPWVLPSTLASRKQTTSG